MVAKWRDWQEHALHGGEETSYAEAATRCIDKITGEKILGFVHICI